MSGTHADVCNSEQFYNYFAECEIGVGWASGQ